MVVCCILNMSHWVLTFFIVFPRFHNGLKQLCSLKLVSILRATLWKVVMKCKIVMFFHFLGFFSPKCSFLRFQNFISPSIKYSINFTFSVVVCICQIHVFNGVIPCHIKEHFWMMSSLSRKCL